MSAVFLRGEPVWIRLVVIIPNENCWIIKGKGWGSWRWRKANNLYSLVSTSRGSWFGLRGWEPCRRKVKEKHWGCLKKGRVGGWGAQTHKHSPTMMQVREAFRKKRCSSPISVNETQCISVTWCQVGLSVDLCECEDASYCAILCPLCLLCSTSWPEIDSIMPRWRRPPEASLSPMCQKSKGR